MHGHLQTYCLKMGKDRRKSVNLAQVYKIDNLLILFLILQIFQKSRAVWDILVILRNLL